MLRRTMTTAAAAALLWATTSAQAAAPTHPSQLPPLTPDAVFPRCSAADLASAGYPDHQHAWTWPGWQAPTGADGLAHGPGTLCSRVEVLPRPGLVSTDAEQRLGPWILTHNPGYTACDMLGFLELLDLAAFTVGGLLDLAPVDSLLILNPDNNQHYAELCGAGSWRLYRRQDARAVLQPIGTLQARTLDGHAAFMLAADWTLASSLPVALPPWLQHGLAEYLAEDGVHLLNYMAEFRTDGSPLYRPAIIDAVLGAAPDGDPGRDRERFRRASYSAFLMAWQLVENRGGLEALRSFLHLVRGGLPLDEASRRVYGLGLSELAQSLDPVVLGEPVGTATESRRPHQQP